MANSDTRKEYFRRYYQRNREKKLADQRLYRKRLREAGLTVLRRKYKRKRIPGLSDAERRLVVKLRNALGISWPEARLQVIAWRENPRAEPHQPPLPDRAGQPHD